MVEERDDGWKKGKEGREINKRKERKRSEEERRKNCMAKDYFGYSVVAL